MSIKELDKFWSHGTGWIRTNDTRSFGYDNGKVINIDELSKYLPIKFDLKDLVPYKVYSGKVKKEGSGISILLPLGNNSIYYSSYKGTYWNKYTNWLEKFY